MYLSYFFLVSIILLFCFVLLQPFINPNPSSPGSFPIPEILSPSQHRYQQYEAPPPPPPPPPVPPSSFINEQFFLSAAALAASHSYPPPSSYLSSVASNLLSSINAHAHLIPSSSNNYFDERKDFQDGRLLLPTDVKNLIESSLTAIGLDNVNDNDFDKAATNAQLNSDLVTDEDIDTFERSTTSISNRTLPTKQITRPVNIPHSFSHDYFPQSSSAAKSPFDTANQLFDEPLESVCLAFEIFFIHQIYSYLANQYLFS